jgi:adenosine kinase
MNSGTQYKRAVVVGSIGFDHVMSLPGKIDDYIVADKLHKLNVSFTVDTLRREFGGTGGNCAFAMGLLGQKPILISSWGNDAEAYAEHLRAVGVGTDRILMTSEDFSAWGHVMTDIDDKQIWMYYPGPLKRMSEIKLGLLLEPGDLVLLMPSEPKAFVGHLEEVIELEQPFLFDPAFFVPNLTDYQLQLGIKHAKMVIANEYEIELMEHKTTKPLADWLIGDKVVIKTLGSGGSEIYQGSQTWRIPVAKPARVGDPTGAGDAYRGGLVAGLLKGLPLPVCGRIGSLVAAYCVEKEGTQTHGFGMPEFLARYTENFAETLNY